MFEDQYEKEEVKGKGVTNNALLPLFGLLIVVALAAIAFVASEPIHQLLLDNVDGDTIPEDVEVQYAIAGGVFLMLLALVSMIYAMFAPKPDKIVPEAALRKEKAETQRQRKMQKRKKQEANRKMAKENRERANRGE